MSTCTFALPLFIVVSVFIRESEIMISWINSTMAVLLCLFNAISGKCHLIHNVDRSWDV